MIIVNQSFDFLDQLSTYDVLSKIEEAGRVCYKSEEMITNNSHLRFCVNIIKNGHHSVLEHASASVHIVTDRGVTHELVRHRIASYSQESTRYCNYSKNKFDNQLTFIRPVWCSIIVPAEYKIRWDGLYGFCEPAEYLFVHDDDPPNLEAESRWFWSMAIAEREYMKLIELGWSPQEARDVLPNSLKTEIVTTMNMREWRHFFTLRAAPNAHPQMRDLAIEMLKKFKQIIPVIFDDIYPDIVYTKEDEHGNC